MCPWHKELSSVKCWFDANCLNRVWEQIQVKLGTSGFNKKIVQLEKLSHIQELDLNSQYTLTCFMALKHIQMHCLRFGSPVKWQKTQNSTDLNKAEEEKLFSCRCRVLRTALVVHAYQGLGLLSHCSNTISRWPPLQVQGGCFSSSQHAHIPASKKE